MTKKKKQAKLEEKPEQTAKKKNSLLEQSLSLLEHFISYFELLFLYYQKIVAKKVQNAFVITIAILYALFLKVLGTVLLFYGIYSYLLKYFQGDIVLTSLVLGSGIIFISFLLLFVMIRKITD